MHTPVLLHEVVKFLEPSPWGFFIDGTIDGGGHAAEILKRISPGGMLLGVDWDETMIAGKTQNKNTVLVHGNYADLPEILKNEKLPKADGLLLDLGFSSEQLEASGRGFSFMKNEPLLMTYDSSRKPVKEILREVNEEMLAKIIFEFGGERFSRKIAKAIKEKERRKRIETTGELSETIRSAVPGNYERGRIEPATRTFQALRIYANDELGNLERVLKNLPEILKRGGRAAIITFHSLEDRIVKNSFRDMQRQNILNILTKKPVTPSREEMRENPRSRSAKLRAAVIT